jgi:hypothetical protein
MPPKQRKPLPAQFVLGTTTPEFTVEAAAEDGAQRPPRIKIDAYNGGPMVVGGWGEVVVDIAGIKASEKVVLLADHRNQVDAIVGYGTAKPAARSLRIEGELSPSSTLAQQIVAFHAEGIPLQASIGAKPLQAEWIEPRKKVRVNGRSIESERGFTLVRAAELVHVAIVANGADSSTTVSIAAKQSEGNTMGFEAWVASLGLVLAELSTEQREQLQLAYDSLQASAAEATQQRAESASPAGQTPVVQAAAVDPTEQIRRQAAAEIERINAIRRVASAVPAIEAQAIREGWDVTRTELEVLRSSRPQAPAVHANRQADEATALEAALTLQCRLDATGLAPQAIEAGQRMTRDGITLQYAILAAARDGGYDGSAHRITRQNFSSVMKHAARGIEASFSTFTLPGILSNVMNKSILAAFMAVEQTWREISSTASVTDFKPIKRYRLTGDFKYESIGPTGEIKHGSLGEQEYSNQAATYAKMFQLTREDIINDDLRALTDVPRMIGRGAALKINEVFWTEFLDNSTFFTSGRNNYFSGTSSPDTRLNIDGLTQAELAFLNQTDPNGYSLGIQPQILLVPNALFVAGTNLMAALEVRNDAGSAAGVGQYMTQNPHAGKFRVVKSSYLSSAAITGNSAKAWYLLASPQDMPVIEMVFLNGVETPTVESSDAEFDQLGIRMRGYHDFGVNLQEYRGGVKMKGEA